MDPANAPLVGMQGPHRYTEAAQLVRLHSAAVPSGGQTLSSFFRVVIDMEDKMFLHNQLILFLRAMKGALGVIVDQ